MSQGIIGQVGPGDHQKNTGDCRLSWLPMKPRWLNCTTKDNSYFGERT